VGQYLRLAPDSTPHGIVPRAATTTPVMMARTITGNRSQSPCFCILLTGVVVICRWSLFPILLVGLAIKFIPWHRLLGCDGAAPLSQWQVTLESCGMIALPKGTP